MLIVDDTRLIELAADRPAELFPALRRASAFRPLFVVLCTVPALYAVEHGAWSEIDSLWGLRSVPILTAPDISTAVNPESRGPEAVLRWQPLLGNWLSATAMHLAGPARTSGQAVVPYLSTVGLVAVFYFLVAALAGLRLAFWGVLLAAFHRPILEFASDHSPYALALAFALGSFLGFLRHIKRGDQAVSFDLLLGGLSLGMCLLAGGPLSVVVVLILMLHVLGLRGERTAAKRGRPTPLRRVWVGWPALKSLAILSLTAFAVGGWWVLMMSYESGTEFWNGWLAGKLHGEAPGALALSSANESYWRGAIGEFLDSTGILSGVALLGIWRSGREMVVEQDEQKRRRHQFVLSWWIVSAFMFALTANSPLALCVTAPLWRMFLLLASILAAAFALDDISQRRVRVEIVGALTIATAFFGYIRAFPENSASVVSTFSILLWVAAAGTLLWGMSRLCAGRESRTRTVLAALVLAHLAANASAGLYAARASGGDGRVLDRFRRALAEHPAEAIVLVADDEPPIRLQFALRSLWPTAEFRVVRVRDDAPTAWNWNDPATAAVPNRIVVEWSRRDSRIESTAGDGIRFTPLGQPQNFDSRMLRSWRVERFVPE